VSGNHRRGTTRILRRVTSDTGDVRAPTAQSYALYRALKDNQVTTELFALATGGHFPGDPIL
jgi:hypothetical protein